MDKTPKTIEELDTLLEQQKKKREIEYQHRKWLFAFSGFLGPNFTFGIGTFPDLAEKDKTFWLLLPISYLLIGVVGSSIYILFSKGGGWSQETKAYLAIGSIIIFILFKAIIGIFFYKKIKKLYSEENINLLPFIFFPFSVRIIAIIVVLLGLYFFYFLSKLT